MVFLHVKYLFPISFLWLFFFFCFVILLMADINLSHWSVNMMSWRVMKACKQALVAFPYATYTSYVVNAPTLIYLLRQFAAKVKCCLCYSYLFVGLDWSRVLRFCAFFCNRFCLVPFLLRAVIRHARFLILL